MNCLVVWNMALMTFHINHQPVKNPSSFGGGFCDSSDETLLGEPRIQRLTIRALQERPPATTPELPWGDILDVRSPLYQRYTVPWSKKTMVLILDLFYTVNLPLSTLYMGDSCESIGVFTDGFGKAPAAIRWFIIIVPVKLP